MSIKKSISLNLVGLILPLLVGVFAIPVLINRLGVERFGILTLAWAIVGYFSIFDFGIGRALTKDISNAISRKWSESDISDLAITGVCVIASVGLPFLLLISFSFRWITTSLINPSVELALDVERSLLMLAFSIPLTLISNGFRGIQEGMQRFDVVNAIRIPQSVLNYLLPMLVSGISDSVALIVMSLVFSRLIFVFISGFSFILIFRAFFKGRFRKVHAISLLKYGGWLSVSNFIAPAMLYMDRFFITSISGASLVAYYTTPFEMATKLWVVPNAVVGVLFPALIRDFNKDPTAASALYKRAYVAVAVILFPILVSTILFSERILAVWISQEFANNSYVIMDVLVLGVLLNSLAQVSAGFIQANGRPDLTAKVNLLEVLPYIGYLYFFCIQYGVVGVAFSWALRAGVNCVCLYEIGRKVGRKI